MGTRARNDQQGTFTVHKIDYEIANVEQPASKPLTYKGGGVQEMFH